MKGSGLVNILREIGVVRILLAAAGLLLAAALLVTAANRAGLLPATDKEVATLSAEKSAPDFAADEASETSGAGKAAATAPEIPDREEPSPKADEASPAPQTHKDASLSSGGNKTAALPEEKESEAAPEAAATPPAPQAQTTPPAGTANASMDASKPAMRIAVFDFSTIDAIGQKFYRHTETRMPPMVHSQLNSADYGTIDDRMLGVVRGLEMEAALQERHEERARQTQLNDRELSRRDELAEKILNSPQRSAVIGSEYMIAALGNYPEAFLPVDRQMLDESLLAVEVGSQADAVKQAREKLGELTGATHALYGVISDCQVEEKSFNGYGVETQNKIYTLDVIVKVVELATNRVTFSGLFTGRIKRLEHDAATSSDTGLYEKLMKDAVGQAAAAMNERFAKKETK